MKTKNIKVKDLVGKPVAGMLLQVVNVNYLKVAEPKWREIESVGFKKVPGEKVNPWLMLKWVAKPSGVQHDCGFSGMVGKGVETWTIQMKETDYKKIFKK